MKSLLLILLASSAQALSVKTGGTFNSVSAATGTFSSLYVSGQATVGSSMTVNGVILTNGRTLQNVASGTSDITIKSNTANGAAAFELNAAGTSGADWVTATGNTGYGPAAEDLVLAYKNVAGTGSTGTKMMVRANGNVGIATSAPGTKLHISSGTLTIDGTNTNSMTISGTAGACLMLEDTDEAGWTECDVLNGVMSCSTDADGICD